MLLQEYYIVVKEEEKEEEKMFPSPFLLKLQGKSF